MMRRMKSIITMEIQIRSIFIDYNTYIELLTQERHNSSANALELRLSCTAHRYKGIHRNTRVENPLHTWVISLLKLKTMKQYLL